MGQIWGEIGLNRKTLAEIQSREELLGTEHKTPEQLVYLGANAPWVILQSGIDVNNSPETAQTYVLTGGRVRTDGNGGFTTRKGLNLRGNDSEGSYYNSSHGFVPMPGIESVTIANRSTWGAVQEATVKFRVYSLEDLNNIDSVYFKPGFTALLEWGWTLSWDGNKTVANTPGSALKFFNSGEKLPDLQKKLHFYRTPDHGILLGYITNFDYSLQKDGSYECNVKILGTGSVLEGMNILPASNEITYKSTSEENFKKDVCWLAPIYKAITEGGALPGRSTLADILTRSNYTFPDEKKDRFADTTGKRPVLVNLKNVNTVTYSVFLKSKFLGRKTEPITYIRLEDMLRLVNAFGLPLDTTPYRFATSGDSKYIDGELVERAYDNEYVCTKTLFSLDPYKVVVPERQKSVIWHRYPDSSGNVNGVSETLVSRETGVLVNGTAGRIFDLWVSLNYVYELFQGEIENQSEDYSTYSCIKNLLTGISKALGNTVDLDISIDEDTCRYYIVDRNYLRRQELQLITPSGTRTTFLDIQAESAVTSDMANMMSIAAQGGKDISPALTSWNYKLSERHPTGDSTNSENSSKDSDWKSREANTSNFWKDAQRLYEMMFSGENANTTSDTSELSESAYSYLQVTGEMIFSEALQIETGNGTGMPVGVFPLRLRFTMKGIDGFVIGECFGVREGVLPLKYKDWGHIVTGVEQNIDTTGWKTTVKTQYFPNNLGDVEGYKFNPVTNVSSNSGENRVTTAAAGTVKSNSDKWSYRVFQNKALHGKVLEEDPIQYMNSRGFRIDTKSEHLCARGTYSYARLALASRDSWPRLLYREGGSRIPKVASTGAANSPAYFKALEAIGYTEIARGEGVAVSEVRAQESSMNTGDIICYWNWDGSKYHTCIRRCLPRTVARDRAWVSDFMQKNMFVYES